MDSIIAGVRAYISGCSALADFKVGKRFVDWTDDTDDNYGMVKCKSKCNKQPKKLQ